jgi:hypothetical protein
MGSRKTTTANRGPTSQATPSRRPPPAQSCRKADLAFQRAMHRAIKAGLEKPPMIGIYKDDRPLDAPRLFAPTPVSSGCTSPAADCADLVSPP